MSKLSIYESAWLNLVFEGKNTQYGAYQLRKESTKTTLYAFLMGVLFIASVSGTAMLLSSFGKVPVEKIPDVEVFRVKYDPITPEPPKPMPPLKHETTPPVEDNDAVDMTENPEIVSRDNADEVKRNDETPTPPETPTGTGTDTGTPTTTTGTGTVPDAPPVKPVDNGPIIITALDKLPEFPGGIQRFYAYVGDNFEKPEIDETVNVLMSFVIEKDGSMTEIKVLRNPGYGLDKEAIRVLRSLRTKWKPGYKDGVAVRVLYTLPIKVTRK